MRVIVPHVAGQLRREVVDAVTAGGLGRHPVLGWELWFIELEDDRDYARLLAQLWRDGATFALVEQDVVPHYGALDELERCLEPWCAFPYSTDPTSRACLGCSRFRAELLRQDPGLMADLGSWRHMDEEVEARLRAAGHPFPHVHQPAVRHLRTGPSSDAALTVRGRIASARTNRNRDR